MTKIKLYDIHGKSALRNFPTLLTDDRKYFYWDPKDFGRYELNDIVFWVNRSERLALYTIIDSIAVKPVFNNGQNLISDERYQVSALAQNEFLYENFYRFKVLATAVIPDGWDYQTPSTFQYQNMALGLLESKNKEVPKKIEKIQDLQQLFEGNTEVADLLDSAIDFLSTGTFKSEPLVWFVTQGSTFKDGQGKNHLWAPQKGKDGATRFYWDNVRKVRKGDLIFNYSGGIRGVSLALTDGYQADNPDAVSPWSKEGYQVDIQLVELDSPITTSDLIQRKRELDAALAKIKNKPFAQNGSVNQGYLYEFTREAGQIVKELYGKDFGDPVIDAFFGDVLVSLRHLEPKEMINHKKLIQHAYDYIQSKGFQYEFDEIANFYLALRTKPFVILAGISGTGKTQLPRQFAEALGFKREQVIQVPVRPDWADSSELLGYTALGGNFIPKDLTIAIQQAVAHPELPYFFILDEMNLARVEHYFSDFLSVIETRRRVNDAIVTDPMLRAETLNAASNKASFAQLQWPENLYLIGTVNMDETTHAFSRKVLDRANSIEMNSVDLSWISSKGSPVEPLRSIDNNYFKTPYLNAAELSDEDKSAIQQEMSLLIEINQNLQKADLHFAYRIRDEVAFYLLLNQQDDLMAVEKAFDFQLVQKVLPRIHGSTERIQTVLVELLNRLEGREFKTYDVDFSTIEKEMDSAQLRYPRASQKILFMLRRYNDDRFTSFWL